MLLCQIRCVQALWPSGLQVEAGVKMMGIIDKSHNFVACQVSVFIANDRMNQSRT